MPFYDYLDKWDTRKGLAVFIGTIFSIGFAIFGFGFSTFYGKTSWHKFLWLDLGLVLIFSCIYYLAWQYRRLPYVMEKKINIIFAFYDGTQSGEIEKYYNNFKTSFLQKLHDHGLSKIKPKFLALDKKIRSIAEAEKFIREGLIGHTLLVWGTLQDFKGEISCTKNHFTYEFSYKKYFPNLTESELKEKFNSNIQETINSVKWNLDLSKRADFETYVDNVYEVSSYILARILLTVKKQDDAIHILKELRTILISRDALARRLRAPLIMMCEEILSFVYLQKATLNKLRREFSEMEDNLELILEYTPRVYPYAYSAHLGMAFVQERIHNDETLARQHLSQAEYWARTPDQAHKFSLGYLALKGGRYEDALRIYNNLERHLPDKTIYIPEVADDCLLSYQETGNSVFMFAEGFIKSVWMPDSGGKKILRKFIKLTEANKEFLPLVEKARMLLS